MKDLLVLDFLWYISTGVNNWLRLPRKDERDILVNGVADDV